MKEITQYLMHDFEKYDKIYSNRSNVNYEKKDYIYWNNIACNF